MYLSSEITWFHVIGASTRREKTHQVIRDHEFSTQTFIAFKIETTDSSIIVYCEVVLNAQGVLPSILRPNNRFYGILVQILQAIWSLFDLADYWQPPLLSCIETRVG